LNGSDALFFAVRDVPKRLSKGDQLWFTRPVEDSKEISGTVLRASEIVDLAEQVLSLLKDEIPRGSLRHDTELMLT
jgi:hypothetical protein